MEAEKGIGRQEGFALHLHKSNDYGIVTLEILKITFAK